LNQGNVSVCVKHVEVFKMFEKLSSKIK